MMSIIILVTSIFCVVSGSDPELEYRIRGHDLVNRNGIFCKLYEKSTEGEWKNGAQAETEVVSDTTNPIFNTLLQSNYHFEKMQTFRLDLLCAADKKLIGSVFFTSGELLKHKGRMTKNLQDDSRQDQAAGKVTIVADEVLKGAHLKLKGVQLLKRGMFKRNINPYFTINYSLVSLFKSPTIENSVNPEWEVTAPLICMVPIPKCSFILNLYSEEPNEQKITLGYTKVEMQKLVEKEGSVDFPLMKSKAGTDKKAGTRGTIRFESVSFIRAGSLVDMLISGQTELDFMVSVDFSKLYKHIAQGEISLKVKEVLRSVGDNFQSYTDETLSFYGFNAFGDIVSPDATNDTGGEFLVNAYDTITKHMESHYEKKSRNGLAPIIQEAIQRVTLNGGKKFTVLYIITDGEIADMEATYQALRDTDAYPLSVTIIGVGEKMVNGLTSIGSTTDTSPFAGFFGGQVRNLPSVGKKSHFVAYHSVDKVQSIRESMSFVPDDIIQFFTYTGHDLQIPRDQI